MSEISGNHRLYYACLKDLDSIWTIFDLMAHSVIAAHLVAQSQRERKKCLMPRSLVELLSTLKSQVKPREKENTFWTNAFYKKMHTAQSTQKTVMFLAEQAVLVAIAVHHA